MALNPDPRPGRWLLPLVVLGMVVFTYVFVRSLPGTGDEQVIGDDTVTTTTTTTSDTTTSTTGATSQPLDSETQAYLDQLANLESNLTSLQTEIAQANSQWENDEISFGDAEAAFADVSQRVAAWADQAVQTVPPEGLAEAHDTVSQFATAAADAAAQVLSGLRAPDTGEARRAALDQFDSAVLGFTAAVDDVEQQARGTGG